MTRPESPPPSTPTKPPRTMRTRNAIILAIVSLLIGVAIGAAGDRSTGPTEPPASVAEATQPAAITPAPTPAATASPTVEPTPTATRIFVLLNPLIVKGSGTQNTKPFDLPAGDYTVSITGSGKGNVIAELKPRSGDALSGESLFNEISNGRYTYETVVYGLAAGSYYIDMTNDGAWTVTFTPLQ